MNWTEIKDWVIPVVTILGSALVQLIGYTRWRREFPAREKKTNSESQNLLGEATESMATASKTMVDALTLRVKALEDDKAERDGYIEALENEIKDVKRKIAILEVENSDLRRQNVLKDGRISELETKTASQEIEISELRKQIENKGE
jgi:predicted RNase H-like nuclease (RuvC/YqgF family)